MGKICREKIVNKFSPCVFGRESASPMTVGNGEFAYTFDVTGTQSLTYDAHNIPTLTMAQWGWHNTPYCAEKSALRTLNSGWNHNTLWGWDFPMLAMCATRLYKPETAIDCLLMNSPKNTYMPNGHNRQGEVLDMPCYLPGNDALLLCVGLMAAGFDGCKTDTPGFPDGWNVRYENISKLI